MTLTAPAAARATRANRDPERFRLHRAGILNVWQYDDQEFVLADGRMLLRGANGAGKSKTLEMLLPFAIDGDKARITASAKHHTSLLWLMTDGYEGQARVGYIWVEFVRPTPEGERTFSCGVGIRSSASARTARAWYFATDQRIGPDLALEGEGGPLSRPRLEEAIGDQGQVFDKAASYREHVGRVLFGLELPQYEEVLRLLYWLRRPQVGEDIEPARLAGQLGQALPQLDEQAVKVAGDTFDELTAFGEQIARRAAAAEALSVLADAYGRYARSVVARRGRSVVAAARQERRLYSDLRARTDEHEELTERTRRLEDELDAARARIEDHQGRINELESGPEARDQKRLGELTELAEQRSRISARARERAERSRHAHDTRAHGQAVERDSLVARHETHTGELRGLDSRQSDLRVGATLAVAGAEENRLDGIDDAIRAGESLAEAVEALRGCSTSVGRRQAAVGLVVEALRQLGEADRVARSAETRADEHEQSWEAARDRRVAAEHDAEGVASDLQARLVAWAAGPAAPQPALPDELTPETVPTLADRARQAADPVLERLRDERQREATRADNARSRIDELERRRADIDAETDPAPPAATLPRDERPDGAGLWRLVDFRGDLSAEHRAGVEAALQSSGLLDAWVRPDGRLLDPGARDVLLTPGQAVAGAASLAKALVPDPSEESDVSAETVAEVLGGIALVDAADRSDHDVAVGVDGSWRLAALNGRAGKSQAQFVGTTARQQERVRRLAVVDAELEEHRGSLGDADGRVEVLEEQVAGLEAWLWARPGAEALIGAWARLEERRRAESDAESANSTAQRGAQQARDAVSRRRRELDELATAHQLPVEAGQVEAIAERLRRLAADLRDAATEAGSLRRDLERWVTHQRALADSAATADADAEEARLAGVEAERAASVLAETQRTVGASVAALQQRLTALRDGLREAKLRRDGLDDELGDLKQQGGGAEERVQQAASALADHHTERGAVLAGFAALGEVPGLLEAAFLDTEAPDRAAVSGAAQVPHQQALPKPVIDVSRACAELVSESDAVDATVVWRSYTDTSNGPAGDHDPRVSEFGDLLAVTGRDDGGEATITELSARVTGAVEADRSLLTQREKERFEQHILGDLGDAIRQCRIEAEELVDAMNRLLGGVTTSQGIRVRLDWRLRDDLPAEAQQAVRLLAQPVGALLPHERTELRDALHRLIEASRAESPELAYGEHLAAALDYRTWFAFRIRYSRPEKPGEWSNLHRRSAVSQGEQKVLCYLPLFAAAAAHFTSLAGAAPYAPRLVLLDDAFPKIDIRTHPLLFGLLVDLDLDFVITSERLWGDHDTVPSLAIYETLRDPGQRGVAQFEYRWDGRQLRSLG